MANGSSISNYGDREATTTKPCHEEKKKKAILAVPYEYSSYCAPRKKREAKYWNAGSETDCTIYWYRYCASCIVGLSGTRDETRRDKTTTMVIMMMIMRDDKER
mmetsp:Transcript_20897/g.58079  ORF Transcript_20897/g.58079 Transcript_20897/m.58079 type:complete len:104 (-) Transcript_20897:5-316(-)